ncbi:hypothetical protein [Gulbenkiania mobilis]|uniref:hypothetical protein n=1 Tax=Gulbenkiania mobilis TaxID=397457 RepID=UPI0006BBAC36|nr:hypothetical protein [Gulbenkiania mobilis]
MSKIEELVDRIAQREQEVAQAQATAREAATAWAQDVHALYARIVEWLAPLTQPGYVQVDIRPEARVENVVGVEGSVPYEVEELRLTGKMSLVLEPPPLVPGSERFIEVYRDRSDLPIARLVRRQGGWLVQLREIASTPAPGTADEQPLDADVFGLLLERAMEQPAERVRPGMDDHAH